ncbi:hypothetical protein Hdeb2414_s0006g00208771 [Helianthus debilis subsp. tardiflorus]
MTQNGCQDQRSSRLFKGCKWCHCQRRYEGHFILIRVKGNMGI